MADDYFALSSDQRREALGVVSAQTGRPLHLLEKDVWVVWALRALFRSPFGEHFIFKGGTSLSKAYAAISRFSEDIDITYDIRAFAPDIVGDAIDALPRTRSQEHRWTDQIRKRLVVWVASSMLPYIKDLLAETGPGAIAEVEGDTINIRYSPLVTGTGYVAPSIKIEFGARSTGEPSEMRQIITEAAAHLAELVFPECEVRTMRPGRTFWEKATAIHVYCLQGELGGERFSRHWYDLTQLDDAGIAQQALGDHALAQSVAAHKTMFFREKDAAGTVIDYHEAVSGKLRLVPDGEAKVLLAQDYAKMLEDGLLPEGAKPFDDILAQCQDMQVRANKLNALKDLA